jgi:hypothetical protein
MNHTIQIMVLAVLACTLVATRAHADGRSKAATELAEFVAQRFGRSAAREGTQALARQIEVSAARHGPDIFQAVRKVGPRALPLVEQAGSRGGKAARVLALHGEAGAMWVVSRPTAMNLVARHGDGAASVLVKHAGGIAEPVVERFGAPAIRALEAVGPQGGRRLAVMMADGHLSRIGRTEELLAVIAKHGERAAAFIWQHKGALAVGATLAAFLANPEPFINGTRDIAKVATDGVVTPVVNGVFSLLQVALIAIGVLACGGVALMYKYGLPKPRHLKWGLALIKR